MNEQKTDSDVMRLTLGTLTESNMDKVLALEAAEDQRRFVPSPGGIVARAWVYREQGAKLWVVSVEERPVGLALVYELEEEPACYYLMEMLIDRREQGKGYGTAAVRELIKRYSAQPRFPMLELSVDRENLRAKHVYKAAGFVDSGYVDPDLPQYLNLVYTF